MHQIQWACGATEDALALDTRCSQFESELAHHQSVNPEIGADRLWKPKYVGASPITLTNSNSPVVYARLKHSADNGENKVQILVGLPDTAGLWCNGSMCASKVLRSRFKSVRPCQNVLARAILGPQRSQSLSIPCG